MKLEVIPIRETAKNHWRRLKPLIDKDNDELNAEFENAKSGLEWIIESEIPKLTNIL